MNKTPVSWPSESLARYGPKARHLRRVLLLSVAVLSFLLAAVPAFAGQASSGELAFFPCTQCHPVTLGADGKPTKPLPNNLEKHEIELELHDILGKDDKACLACHDDPARNPGKLILPDGSLVDIKGDVSKVCQRCHFEKYTAWQMGVHGKHQPKCSSAGCHDPHTPGYVFVEALPPFLGSGFQAEVLPETVEFVPLAPPPDYPFPATYTPTWLVVVTAIGLVMALGVAMLLIRGRLKR